jgi:hypothetical protein
MFAATYLGVQVLLGLQVREQGRGENSGFVGFFRGRIGVMSLGKFLEVLTWMRSKSDDTVSDEGGHWGSLNPEGRQQRRIDS